MATSMLAARPLPAAASQQRPEGVEHRKAIRIGVAPPTIAIGAGSQGLVNASVLD